MGLGQSRLHAWTFSSCVPDSNILRHRCTKGYAPPPTMDPMSKHLPGVRAPSSLFTSFPPPPLSPYRMGQSELQGTHPPQHVAPLPGAQPALDPDLHAALRPGV